MAYNSTDISWHGTANQVIGISFVVAAPLICVGNFASVVGIIQDRRLHTTTMGLILNMSFADFLTGVSVCGYNAFVYLQDSGRLLHYKWYCHWMNVLSIIFLGQSLLTNLLLSVERFIAICHPFKHLVWVTKTRLFGCVIFGWLYCIVATFVPLVTEHNNWDVMVDVCTPRNLYPKEYVMFVYANIVIVIFSNFYFQIRVAQQVFIQHKRIVEMLRIQPLTAKVLDRKSELKKGKLTVILFLAFMVCWSPYLISSPLNVYIQSDLLLIIRDIAFVLGTFNSFINFFIYSWKNKELRNSSFRVLRCVYSRETSTPFTSTHTSSSRRDTHHA